jgi:hypothetical protein
MTKAMNLNELLYAWYVMPPDGWENDDEPHGWWAVCNDDGIVAYFADEVSAFRFRLAEINRALNG